MSDGLPFRYWDANVLLSYINGVPARLPDIDALLQKSGDEFQIITSSLSVVEVAFAKVEQDQQVLDANIESKIAALWASDSPVKLVDFSLLLAEQARDLMRTVMVQGLRRLKPLDAVHLATAMQMRAAEFNTYDNDLHGYADITGLRIGPPLAPQPHLPTG